MDIKMKILQPNTSSEDGQRSSSAAAAAKLRRIQKLNTELLETVLNAADKIEETRKLVERGARVTAFCRTTELTALHLAALTGNKKIVSYLLSHGADAKARDKLGRQPVHLATWNNHVEVLLCFNKADLLKSPIQKDSKKYIKEEDMDSWNHHHEDLTDTSQEFKENRTALHLACMRLNTACVDYILKKGISFDLEEKRGSTALDVVGLSPYRDDEDTASYSIDANPFNFQQQTDPLGFAVYGPAAPPTRNENNNSIMTRTLTTVGSLLRTQQQTTKTNSTILHSIISQKGDPELLTKLLIKREISIMSRDELGKTAFHVAVEFRRLLYLNILLECAFEHGEMNALNSKDTSGQTPLHLAVESEWEEGIDFLLTHNADVNIPCNSERTVLHRAAEKGNSKILKELLLYVGSEQVMDKKDKEGYTPLCKAVENGSLDSVKALVDKYAKTEVILNDGKTLLHICVEKNFPHILQYLIDNELVVTVKDELSNEKCGRMTALQLAATEGRTECIEVLLKFGCSTQQVPSIDPQQCSTALHLAAKNNNASVVEMLLKEDSTVLKVKDGFGWYPLHIAAFEGHSENVFKMINYGADLSDSISYKKGIASTGLDIILSCIPEPLKFLERVFNNCITTNELPLSDPNCQITVNLNVLVPEKYHDFDVLMAILRCDREIIQEHLLPNIVIQIFLRMKWEKLKWVFYFCTLLRILYVVFFTSVSVCSFIYEQECPILKRIYYFLTFLSIFTVLLPESVRLYNFKAWEPVITITGHAYSILVMLFLNDVTRHCTLNQAAISVSLLWIQLLFILAKHPSWGIYVHMFFAVAVKVIKVLATFCFLLIGFALAFWIQFKGKEPFTSLPQSIIKVLVMSIELDYESVSKNCDDPECAGILHKVLIILFVFLVAIVLMNLMIGLAVNDIGILEAQTKWCSLADQGIFFCVLNRCPDIFQSRSQFKEMEKTFNVNETQSSNKNCDDSHLLTADLKNCLIEKVADLRSD